MDAKTLAPGDVVLLEKGSRVPADGHLLTCIELSVDESALTGESIAVLKQTDAVSEQAAPAEPPRPAAERGLGDDANSPAYILTSPASAMAKARKPAEVRNDR